MCTKLHFSTKNSLEVGQLIFGANDGLIYASTVGSPLVNLFFLSAPKLSHVLLRLSPYEGEGSGRNTNLNAHLYPSPFSLFNDHHDISLLTGDETEHCDSPFRKFPFVWTSQCWKRKTVDDVEGGKACLVMPASSHFLILLRRIEEGAGLPWESQFSGASLFDETPWIKLSKRAY